MIKNLKISFSITNESLILATPLILFMLVLSIYLGVAEGIGHNLISALLVLVVLSSMVAAFLSGWLYMVKKAICLYDKNLLDAQERSRANFALLKEFNAGVGKFFPKFLIFVLFFALAFIALVVAVYVSGKHFIGPIGVGVGQLKNAMMSPIAAKDFVSGLSTAQLLVLNKWYVLLFSATAFFHFLTMFWTPEIIYGNRNPFVALFKSVKNIFKKPLGALGLFILLMIFNLIFSLVNSISAVNVILYFLATLAYFYFIVYMVVLVFLYYERNHVETESNCDSGADGVGQD